jgi:hypothetical protein
MDCPHCQASMKDGRVTKKSRYPRITGDKPWIQQYAGRLVEGSDATEPS